MKGPVIVSREMAKLGDNEKRTHQFIHWQNGRQAEYNSSLPSLLDRGQLDFFVLCKLPWPGEC